MTKPPRATIDFETRSACILGGTKGCGAWTYSMHPTTEVLCMAWRLPHWEEGRTGLWHPAFPELGLADRCSYDPQSYEDLIELVYWIQDGGLIEAHNVFFEYSIWSNVCLPIHGFPTVQHEQWRCSAAKASAHALPRALEDAASALRLEVRKDMDGSKVMKKVTKPRKARKKELQTWEEQGVAPPARLYHEELEQLETLWAYCRQDVLAEEALSDALPDLSEDETALFLMDLAINAAGFQLDMDGVAAALILIEQQATILNAELAVLTEGTVKKATERAKMIAWFDSQGLWLDNTQGDTLDDLLHSVREGRRRDVSPKARRALEIVRALGRSSTAKYTAMRNWAASDGRVRGGLRYHGASTGRWAGAGVQPHNFVRGDMKEPGVGSDHMEALWATIKSLDAAALAAFVPNLKAGTPFGDVMTALSQACRGAIIPTPGKTLYIADFASIEARVLMWLAEDEDALAMFRSGADIYSELAIVIYKRPINKHDHPKERQLGKAGILGCGYQMGAAKFVDTARDMFQITITFEESQNVVDAYRKKFWRVKDEWGEQEYAAIEAMLTGEAIEAGCVVWEKETLPTGYVVLYCTLPSGRRLAYPDAKVQMRETSWGAMKQTLTYMGINMYNSQWERQLTYGGKLVENIVQAISRDLMVAGMIAASAAGYEMILTVHDEMISERIDGQGSLAEFETLMATTPPWAEGCPVSAEGYCGKRYRK